MVQAMDLALGELSPSAPRSSEELAEALGAFGVSLPVEACVSSPGSLTDAHGVEFAVVDQNATRTNAEALALAQLIATAINFSTDC